MTAVKPPMMPPLAQPSPRPAQGPGGNAGAGAVFKPGVEARSAPAAPPAEPSQAPQARPSAAAPPAGEARQLFTLQALSAYAGAIINDLGDGEGTQVAGSTGNGTRRNSPDAPPPRPGGLLDFKA